MIFRKITILVILCCSIFLMQISGYAAIDNLNSDNTNAVVQTLNNLNLSDGIIIDEGDDLSKWTRNYNVDLSIDRNDYVSGSESLKIVEKNASTGYFILEKHAENIISSGDIENFEINMNIPDVSSIYAIGVAFF